MDNNYWYYTLSAIPQTLAAMIALSAMFVVFKLSIVSEKIRESRKDLRRFILLVTSNLDKNIYQTEIDQIEPLKDDEFVQLFEAGLNTLDSEKDFMGLEEKMFEKYQREMKRIIESEWYSAFPARQFRIFGYLTRKKETLKRLLATKKESIRLLISSLVLGAFTIIVSLVVLPNYGCFNGSFYLVLAIVLMSTLSVFVTSYSAWRIAIAKE